MWLEWGSGVHHAVYNFAPTTCSVRRGLSLNLGTPVVPFCSFFFYVGVSLLLKLNSRNKGTRIINGLLGNLGI